MSTADTAVRADNRSLLVRLVVIAAAMFAFGYALVPFYEQICRVTGLRDIGRPDEVRNTQVDATRNVRIELDANTRGLPWRFKPLAASIDQRHQHFLFTLHPGAGRAVLRQRVATAGFGKPLLQFRLVSGQENQLCTCTLAYGNHFIG